jgi:uncharacterized membrane protein
VNALTKTLRVINLASAGIEAGGQLFCLVALVPALKLWPTQMGVRVHQDALTVRPESLMKPTGIVAATSAAGLLLLNHNPKSRVAHMTLLGLIGVLVNGFISARWEWPVNDAINAAPGETVPENYAAMRRTWDTKHAMRTVASSAALLTFILASLERQAE